MIFGCSVGSYAHSCGGPLVIALSAVPRDPPRIRGPVAQLGERLVCIQEVQSPRAERRVGATRERCDRLESTSHEGDGSAQWARSSAGRAPGLHPGGRRFEPGRVHQRRGVQGTRAYSSVWLERTPDKREVGGSNPPRPTIELS